MCSTQYGWRPHGYNPWLVSCTEQTLVLRTLPGVRKRRNSLGTWSTEKKFCRRYFQMYFPCGTLFWWQANSYKKGQKYENCFHIMMPFNIEGILPKGPYPSCLRMADRALLAGYPQYDLTVPVVCQQIKLLLFHCGACVVHHCPVLSCIVATPGRATHLMPAWIINHMPSKVWHEITYPFPKRNGFTVKVWE